MERIKRAAILKDGICFEGRRHGEIIRDNYKLAGPFKGPNVIQGFVTDTGRFVGRKEAEVIARACGQVKGELLGSILTSEDLY